MELCIFCGAGHDESGRARCPWTLLADKIDQTNARLERLELRLDSVAPLLASISERTDTIMSTQADLDTELTAVEASEAAEEAELTQESADLKTLLAAIPPETAVNLAPEIARLQTLATTMGARTTTATADDKSITAETAALEPPPTSGTAAAAAPAPSPAT